MIRPRDLEKEINERISQQPNFSQIESELDECVQFLSNVQYHETSLEEYNSVYEKYSKLLQELQLQ